MTLACMCLFGAFLVDSAFAFAKQQQQMAMFYAALIGGPILLAKYVKGKVDDYHMNKAIEEEVKPQDASATAVKTHQVVLNVYDSKQKNVVAALVQTFTKTEFYSLDEALEALKDLPEHSSCTIKLHEGNHFIELPYLRLPCSLCIESASNTYTPLIYGKSLSLHSMDPNFTLSFANVQFMTSVPETDSESNEFAINCSGPVSLVLFGVKSDNTAWKMKQCHVQIQDCEFCNIKGMISAVSLIDCSAMIQQSKFHMNQWTSLDFNNCGALDKPIVFESNEVVHHKQFHGQDGSNSMNYAAMKCFETPLLSVRCNKFYNNFICVDIEASPFSNAGTFELNEFSYNNFACMRIHGGKPIIKCNKFHNNGGMIFDISQSLPIIQGNNIQSNIQCDFLVFCHQTGTQVVFEKNYVCNNVGSVFVCDGAKMDLIENKFSGNGSNELSTTVCYKKYDYQRAVVIKSSDSVLNIKADDQFDNNFVPALYEQPNQ